MRKLLLTCDQVFDVLTRGPFPSGDETDQPVDPEARDLVTDFQDLSEEARREVRDFVRFKKLQQQEPEGQVPTVESHPDEKS